MKKLIYIFAVVIFLFSCRTTNRQIQSDLRELQKNLDVYVEGYIGSVFLFSDTRNRNLKIVFLNDSILELSNTSKISTVFHRTYLNFKCTYSYRALKLNEVKIINDTGCKIGKSSEIQYLKPFEYRGYTIDENAVHYIFPNITNDTIRFSSDLNRLQIREFCFERSE